MKNLAIVLVALLAVGCATTRDVKLVTKTIPVAVPLIYSPAPPVIPRPDLPHLNLTDAEAKADGRVVQAYAGSIEALIGYSEQLETALAEYKTINESYSKLRTKLIADWKINTGTDITIVDPTVPMKAVTSVVAPVKPASVPTKVGTPQVPTVDDLVTHH